MKKTMKVLAIMLAVMLGMTISVGVGTPKLVTPIHAISEDDFWDVYDAVDDLTYSGIPITQARIDDARALVDELPDDTDFYGITKQTLTETLDFIQREFDESQEPPVEDLRVDVTVIVDDKVKNFGEKDPEWTYTVEGELEGNPLKILGIHRYSQVVFDELTEEDEQPGIYVGRIVVTYVENPDYKVKVILGDLTILDVEEDEEEVIPPVDDEEETPPVDDETETDETETDVVDDTKDEVVDVVVDDSKEEVKDDVKVPVINKVPNTALDSQTMKYVTLATLATMLLALMTKKKRK